jgi:Flp pilus assembly protein TadB
MFNSLIYEGIILFIAFILLFLGLKLAITLLRPEEPKTVPLIPSKPQPSEKSNPYVQVAEALEKGDQGALLWLMSQNTTKSRILKALNSVSVDLFLGIASLLTVLSVYIVINALPVSSWIVALMAIAALILVGVSYWRAKG